MRTSNYLRQGKRRQNRAQSEQQIDYASSDQVAGKDSLASLLDVSVTMVEHWIREGLPVVQFKCGIVNVRIIDLP